MIQIVNWLLTRRCNYKCGYCGLIKNFPDQPSCYPNVADLAKKELSADQVIECLRKFKIHNPNCFHIFYGGEPFLYKGIGEVLAYCNKENIQYTVITNGSEFSRKELRKLLNTGVIDHLEGLTCSIDPEPISSKHDLENVSYKTQTGFVTLNEFKDIVKDRVAEVTLTTKNLPNAMGLLRFLTNEGIYASLTSIDLRFNPAYDFSNIPRSDYYLVLHKTWETRSFIKEVLMNGDLLIHMRSILPKLWDVLPRNHCWSKHLPDNIHNISIDADGSLRLCLRIRGEFCPLKNVVDLLDNDGNITELEYLKMKIAQDRNLLCDGCNWTCRLMSKETIEDEKKVKDLLHSDRR
jgi:organic radical activating enzyme